MTGTVHTWRPAIYPCGCSYLKVRAGMCDIYGPDENLRVDQPKSIDKPSTLRTTSGRIIILYSAYEWGLCPTCNLGSRITLTCPVCEGALTIRKVRKSNGRGML